MVSGEYKLRNTNTSDTPLQQLLGKQLPIVPAQVVDWKMFFNGGEAHNKALMVNTAVVSAMTSVPSLPGCAVNPAAVKSYNVAELNLLAGEQANVTTGVEWVKQLQHEFGNNNSFHQLDVVAVEDYGSGRFSGEAFNGLPVADLPLWPYLLLEAEQSSSVLGPLGSLLNAEVLMRAISSSEVTVVTQKRYSFEHALRLIGEPFSSELCLMIAKVQHEHQSVSYLPVMEALIELVNCSPVHE